MSGLMNPEQTRNLELSKTAFELVEERIPPADAKLIREHIYDYNEWGLGVETIVDVLLEDQVVLTTEQRDAIVAALDAMGIDRSQHLLRVLD